MLNYYSIYSPLENIIKECLQECDRISSLNVEPIGQVSFKNRGSQPQFSLIMFYFYSPLYQMFGICMKAKTSLIYMKLSIWEECFFSLIILILWITIIIIPNENNPVKLNLNSCTIYWLSVLWSDSLLNLMSTHLPLPTHLLVNLNKYNMKNPLVFLHW